MHLNDTERTNKLKVIISATRLQLKDTILNQLINKSFLVWFFHNLIGGGLILLIRANYVVRSCVQHDTIPYKSELSSDYPKSLVSAKFSVINLNKGRRVLWFRTSLFCYLIVPSRIRTFIFNTCHSTFKVLPGVITLLLVRLVFGDVSQFHSKLELNQDVDPISNSDMCGMN